jgi:hypothetical protein
LRRQARREPAGGLSPLAGPPVMPAGAPLCDSVLPNARTAAAVGAGAAKNFLETGYGLRRTATGHKSGHVIIRRML